MRLYETMLILHPELTDDRIGSFLDRIDGIMENSGGKITEIDQWGLKKLAYRIQKQPRGYYVVLRYAAETALINELERNLKISEECMRFITVNLEEDIDPASLESIERVHKAPPSAPEPEEEEAAPAPVLDKDEGETPEPEEEVADDEAVDKPPPEDLKTDLEQTQKPQTDGEEKKE